MRRVWAQKPYDSAPKAKAEVEVENLGTGGDGEKAGVKKQKISPPSPEHTA